MTDEPNTPSVGPGPIALTAPNLRTPAAPLWPSPLPSLFTEKPTPELVIATLDSEMARLEQSVARSGWTSWAGTAALGGLAWALVTIFDSSNDFPWFAFVTLTTLISFIQDFVYGLNDVLRPQRGHGLVVRGQARVIVSKETLPFARKHYSFVLLRAALLATSCYLVLPALVGWLWWVPFVAYILACVAMTSRIIISTLLRAIPKREGFYLGALIGQVILTSLAIWALIDFARSWQAVYFVALEAAFLVIAASHVLRSLARPQFELPALDRLRDVRRRLGFSQITAIQAVEQAEAALYGYSAMRASSDKLKALTRGFEGFTQKKRDLFQRITTLAKHIVSLQTVSPITPSHIRIGEALIRDVLSAQNSLIEAGQIVVNARQALQALLDHYKQKTQNDASIPMVDYIIKTGDTALFLGAKNGLVGSQYTTMHINSLRRLASANNLPLAPQLQDEVNATQANFASQMTMLKQIAASTEAAPEDSP